MSLPKMKAAVLMRLDRPLDIVSEIEFQRLTRRFSEVAYSGVCHSH